MANIRKTFNFRNGVQVDDDNLVVNPTGLVGIGTTVPTEALDVRGDVKVVGLVSATTGTITGDLTVNGNLIANGFNYSNGQVGAGVSVGAPAGIITSPTTTGIVTYYGDGKYLLNLPNSQWVDIDVGLGFTSIYARGWVGVQTSDPRYPLQIGGALVNGSIAGGVGIGSTGDIHATGIITAGKFSGSLNGNVTSGVSTLGIATADSFVVNGISTADGFVGPLTGDVTGNVTGRVTGNLVGNVYATGISTFGDLTVTSGDIQISSGVVTATSFEGAVTGSIYNNIGISTIVTLNTVTIDGTGGSIKTGVLTATSATLGVTTTAALRAESLSIGLNPTGKQIEVFAAGISTVDLTGTEESRIIFGNQSGTANGIGQSTGLIRYGNEVRSLDIINNDYGDINQHLNMSGQSVGVGTTGAYNWYHQTSDLLMTLTHGGNLGINKANPEYELDITGIASVSSNLTVGGDLEVAGNIGGNIQVNELNGNVNATTGVSTFNNIKVTNVGTISSLGIGTDSPLVNIGLDARTKTGLFESVGIGTTTTSVALQVVGAGRIDNLGIGSAPGTDGFLVKSEYCCFEDDVIGINSCSITAEGNTYVYFDGNAAIGIGTTVARAAIDFAYAGSGTLGTATRYMIPPRITNTERLGLSTETGAFIYNTDSNTLQIYNGSTWLSQATGGAQNLDGLTDVSLSSPQNGQSLGYNGTNWTNNDNALNDISDVTITSAVAGDTLAHNGTGWVNDNTVSLTRTSTAQVALHTLGVATYRSAEYLIQASEGSNFSLVKILAIHNGTTVSFTEFGSLATGSTVASYTMDVSGGNMRLLVSPASANSTTFKVKYTTIKV